MKGAAKLGREILLMLLFIKDALIVIHSIIHQVRSIWPTENVLPSNNLIRTGMYEKGEYFATFC
jgi:hypothetical protein